MHGGKESWIWVPRVCWGYLSQERMSGHLNKLSEWIKEWNNEIRWVELSVEPGPWDDADKWAGGWGWVRHDSGCWRLVPSAPQAFAGLAPGVGCLSSSFFTELTVHWEDQGWNKHHYTPRYRSKGTECSTQVFVCEYSYQCSSQQPNGENNSNAHQLPNG